MSKFKTYRESIDIDYYVYFTKSYFAFNAYLKEKYPSLTDKDQIAKMQTNTTIINKFEHLVNSGKHFKDDLISLQDIIIATKIMNNGKLVNLSEVKIGKHEVGEIFNEKYNRIKYYIRAIDGGKFTFKVKNKQSKPFLYEDLEANLQKVKITSTQRQKVKSEIIGFASRYILDFSKEIDKLNKFNEYESVDQSGIVKNIYQGYMAILYKLRNALFHSEVEPDEDVMKVYKFAYFTLRKIIHKIPTN